MKRIVIKAFLVAWTFLSLCSASAYAQYQKPTDPQVLEKLDTWRDNKFGVLMHWGLYSVPGIVESWNLCNEFWVKRPEGSVYEEYKKWYWGLSNEFNPTDFDPDQWADVFEAAGMRYMIFTTKHHDGFCLYESHVSDFSIAKGPFADNPKADAAKFVFEAFRRKGFMVGAYFSKPDWHHPGYWNPYYATPDRHHNYDISQHPEWWESYVRYTRNQLMEICGGAYGSLDILWLDGGWEEGETFGLSTLLPGFRAVSPGLICVDRTIGGPNENYQTPEQSIPDVQQDWPWESCITLSDDWGWTPDHHYKSSRTVIGLLAQIVAKGGCFVLGVGPTPQGLIDPGAEVILHEIGDWLARCGESIYSTVCVPEYGSGNIWFTGSKDGKTVYAIYCHPDGKAMPKTVEWEGNIPSGKVTILNNGKKVKAKVSGRKVSVDLPRGLRNEPVAIKIQLAR